MEPKLTEILISVNALSGTLAWAFGIVVGLLSGLYVLQFFIYSKVSKLEKRLRQTTSST